MLSDHGEEFWEHGQVGHGKSLYNEVIRVPFMIYAPNIKAARIPDHISTIDLLPTLSELLKFNKNDIWQGKSLVSLIDENQKEDRFLFSELLRKEGHPRPEFRSVVSPDWHYITTKPKDGKISEELYNARTDFAEKQNKVSDRSEIAKNLALKLYSIGKKVHNSETHIEKPISPEGLEELRTLGYAE